jgi:outer membrane protein assembly factor BamB
VSSHRRADAIAFAATLALVASALVAVGTASQDAGAAAQGDAASSWTVYHGDAAGTGVSSAVASIDTRNRVWTSPLLDGQLYGEPLAYNDDVFVATENDTVYALNSSTGAVIWARHLARPVPSGDLPCGDISPTVGITGTPVIDPARNELFVVADELIEGHPHHRLVGLSARTGGVELIENVDPPGADPANLLQRTGLNLDGGRVIFAMGGNYGDCATYRGRVGSVAATGSTPRFFTVDANPDDNQGAIWMGGAAPVVSPQGDIWVATGNGSVYSASLGYDDSDAALEISPSMHLVQYFAPTTWPQNNSQDLDMSTAPVLLPDGQVMLAGKSRIVYLLNGAHLGGIGHDEASLGSACSDDIDGGSALVGDVVYLPCVAGPIAVRYTRSPPTLRILWRATVGGGPPIFAGGLVWTIGQNGVLYGLNPRTGSVVQQVSVSTPANHFPTPSVGDGLFLVPSAYRVDAFATVASN